VAREGERCQREQADRDIVAPRCGRGERAACAAGSPDYPQDGPGCLLPTARSLGMRCRAAGESVSHRIVWSGWSLWLMTQASHPFLDGLTLGLTALITSAVAGLGLSPTHPAPGPEMMSMHLVLRR
jgi:hypothetical protein